jgi:hypothetical protein
MIALVRNVAERMGMPRALAVPFPFGHALGAMHDTEGQRDVMRHLVHLLESPGPGPVLRDYIIDTSGGQ